MQEAKPLLDAPEPRADEIPLADQIRCIEREIAKRMNVYPHLVQRGKLTAERSVKEIATMQAVLHTLRQLVKLRFTSIPGGSHD